MAVEIDGTDVIHLIEQYLKENNLFKSLDALQVNETGISLNTIDNVDTFLRDIRNGHWDIVLQSLQNLKVPNEKLFDVYEQIIFELVELREIETARVLLRKTQPMELLRFSNKERFKKLESIINKSFFEPKDVYPVGVNKEKRRQIIAQNLKEEINVVPPSRLLSLLLQALKYQHGRGILPPCQYLDLFRNKPLIKSNVVETYPTEMSKEIKFAKDVYPVVVIFSPDGQYLVSGSSDGFIEVWNYQTGQLRSDLVYQQQDNLMLMDTTITALSFSNDSDMLLSGDKNGKINVWYVETGSIYKRFDKAHQGGVNVVLFNRDQSHVVSGGSDCIIRIHGMKSGRCLREFVGHTSYVNDILLANDGVNLISCSSDGNLKIWSYRSGECINTIHSSAGVDNPVNCLQWINDTYFVVCCRSSLLYIMSTTGEIINSFKTEKQLKVTEYLCGVISPLRGWYYAVDQDNLLHCFNIQQEISPPSAAPSSDPASKTSQIHNFTSTYEFSMKVHEKDTLSLCHHPNQNIMCTGSKDGVVRIWTAV